MKKLLLFLFIVAASLAAQPIAAKAQVVQIDGSSTVFPVTEAVAEEFQKAKKGKLKVTVGISGTGGGFKKFCRGETDIQRRLSADLETGNRGLQRRPGWSSLNCRSPIDALNGYRQSQKRLGDIDDRRRTEKNLGTCRSGKGHQLESGSTQLARMRRSSCFGAGADSGTFDYFTEAIVGKAKSSRGDFTASEDDNVLVQGVANDTNALGFFGFAYYAENTKKLKAVAVDSGKGGVAPFGEDRARRQLSAAFPPDLHLCEQEGTG